MTFAEARYCIGAPVRWRGPDRALGLPTIYGHITRVIDRYVYVRFDGDRHATGVDPHDLQLLTPIRR